MKRILLLLLLVQTLLGFSQPPPDLLYPERIKVITEKLKTDSLNYELIWERLTMLVGSGSPSFSELFSIKTDSNRVKNNEHDFKKLNSDFNKIYQNYIQEKDFKVVEEGDFYLKRISFYSYLLEFDKAINDANYLQDSASYSKYSGRGEYYNKWAQYSLFNLYIITDRYDEALETINNALDKEKNKNPKLYYTFYADMISYMQKIQLFEQFNKSEELILFLKQYFLEHLEWYFEKSKLKNAEYESWRFNDNENYTDKSNYLYYMEGAKDKSFHLLKLLVKYMQKYNDKELPKYEKIYNEIRYEKTVNFETINPEISDEELIEIMKKITLK